jgi:drug/metabolite transporter (DMT)-like permease
VTAKRRLTLKIFIFLISTDVLETFAQFCFKKSAACQNFSAINTLAQAAIFIKAVVFSPFLWLALFSVLLIFIIWSAILSKIDLSVAVPVASFSYITVPLVSAIFLHEKISGLRWLGIVIILIGVILVSKTARHREEPA